MCQGASDRIVLSGCSEPHSTQVQLLAHSLLVSVMECYWDKIVIMLEWENQPAVIFDDSEIPLLTL